MRIAELCALQWENVDFEKNEITIEHSLAYFPHKAEEPTDPKEKLTYKSCYYEMHEPKTKAGKRTIPMFKFVRECLLAEKKRQEDYGIKCSIHVQGYSNFVFLNRYNRPYEPPNLPTALKRQIRHCNMYNEDHGKTDVLVPNVTCHAFRHTFACRLIEGCIHPIVVQKMMGHEDVSTLMNIYVECQDSFANKEFGISSEEYADIIGNVNSYFDHIVVSDIGQFDYEEFHHGEGTSEEQECLGFLHNPEYEVVFEKHGWSNIKDFIDEFIDLEDGAEYALYIRVTDDKAAHHIAFANTILGVLLAKNPGKKRSLYCNIEKSADDQNHFWLLKRKKY